MGGINLIQFFLSVPSEDGKKMTANIFDTWIFIYFKDMKSHIHRNTYW